MGLGYSFRDGDWPRLRQIIQKLSSLNIGPEATPVFAGLTINGGTIIDGDLVVTGDITTQSALIIDDADSVSAVLTMDGTANAPGTLTYNSDEEIFTFDQELIVAASNFRIGDGTGASVNLHFETTGDDGLFTYTAATDVLSFNKALTVTGDLTANTLTITGPDQDWLFGTTVRDAVALGIISGGAGSVSRVVQHSTNGDGSTGVFYELFSVGTAANIDNRELLQMGWLASGTTYVVRTLEGGTGTQRPLLLSADASLTQLVLQTDGDVSIANLLDVCGGITVTDSALHVDGTITTNSEVFVGPTSDMLALLNITGNTANIGDRHEGLWMRSKVGAWIVQLNVRGPRLEIGGGASLDTTPAMSVNYNTGRVGIGTTAPGFILDIDAGEIGDNNYDGLRIIDTGWKAFSHPMLEFYNSHAGFNGSLARIYGEIGSLGENSKLYFAVADSSMSLQDRMVIDKSGNLGIGTTTPSLPLSVLEKSGRTAIGGSAVKLTNKTGGSTVAGQLVEASTPVGADTDDAFETAAMSADNVIGIVLDAGVADGSEAWVVVSGIADVLMDAGGSARGDRIISSATAGSADVWNVGGAVATHFLEIGHCIETRVGAGLARCILHFN